jgi:Pumilio-family RNA binding repeat
MQRELTLYDLIGHFMECSLDQQCSRFIQQRLEEADDNEKQALFSEIIGIVCPNTAEFSSHKLMKDVFGNYVVQKMFEFGTNNQRKDLFSDLKGSILNLSCDQYGCRVV